MKKKRLHFLARAAMTLLLVMFATIGARADEGTLSGSGTAADPYLIGSDADWETFVSYINDKGGNYRFKNYKLTADIKVTSMAGKNNDDNAFKGVFDGNGHTMTLDLTDDGNSNCAPFRYVGGSTFKRLHVAGKITSNSYYVASLVGYHRWGTLNIYNCWSSVDIVCTKKTYYSYNAGFVGYSYDSNININNCRFDGSLQGTETGGWSGFVGQRISSSSSMNISNCLFAPTQLTVATDYSYTFARNSDVITNSYYTMPLGTEQGTAVGTMADSELLNSLGKGWEKRENKIVPVFDIKNLSTGSIECNTFWAYTGEEVTVTPTVKDMDGNTVSAENYSVSFSPSPVKEVGPYTMTVASNTANGYSGTLTHQFEVANNISGTGTKEDPYLITSTDDWNVFAKSVAGGIDYSKKYVKLTNDITISTMVGVCDESGDRPFSGTFDGANHTLTANITSTATGDDENNQGVAPFHLIKQATIQNLTVAGNITSASKYAAGLVGWVDGNYRNNSYIKDCIVKATITTSADYAGGFVGNICYSDRNYLYFTNSVFAGRIINTSSDDSRSAGGFCGYGYSNSYFNNCLENGSYTNITYMNPRNAKGSQYNDNVTSLYYVNKIAVNNKYIAKEYGCYQVANTAPADELYLPREIKGYQFYQSVWITGLNDSYPYNNGEAVSLAYELKTNSGKLTKDTDYTVTLSPNEPAAVGDYTISFTAKEGNSGGYAGTTKRTFSVMKGENLDGYVFDTEGEGESKVYLINNERDLERLAAYVNSGHGATGITFKQNANITLTAAHTSIGGYFEGNNRYFKGTYDGNNKTISNLNVNAPNSSYQGLFGYTSNNAVIKNVTLTNCNITGKQNTGGIVGYAINTTIENCHVSGNICATASDAGEHGGIVGSATATSITNCTVTGTISTSVSNGNYGGIVGVANYDVVITSCENAANISGDGLRHGGIVGRDNSSSNKFKYCLNTGEVKGGNQYVGAIAGERYYSSNFDHCYYPNQSTIKAFGTSSSSNDYTGYGEVAYVVTLGKNIRNIEFEEQTVITSVFSGKKYCAKGDWTLTLTPDQTDVTFVSYACEGGTLSDLTTADGTHKLTITDKDVTISALVSNNDATDVNGVTIAAIPDMRWRGNNVSVVPTISMTNGETPLVLGTDYLVEGSNNTAIGEATITIKGINSYKGTTTKTFNIVDFSLQDASVANSASNPYLITTAEDLEALASIVNTGTRLGGYYKQCADITLTNEHTAIGNNSSNTSFSGLYNGDNKVIKGLLINQAEGTYQGLFGRTYNANIQNVIIENCDITAKSYVGGICGYADLTPISNCKVSGAIKTADGVDGTYHGGIAGYINRPTSNCVNTASVTGGNNAQNIGYGGIVGCAYRASVTDCFNAGFVEGTSFVGSIVGKNNSSALSKNYHTTTTTGGVGADGVATGTDQAGTTTVAKITAAEGVTLTLPTTTKPTYVWNNENLFESGVVVTLDCKVPDGKYWDRYTVNNGSISKAGTINGNHTLTDFTADVVISATFANELTDISTAGVTIADIEDLTYNGKEQHPAPVVTLSSDVLEADANYQVTYSDGCNNVGTYTIIVTGIGRYTGTLQKTFKIVPYDISGCDLKVENQKYTGKAINVTPTVKMGSVTLAQGAEKDYTFVTNPTTVQEAGDYTLTVTGKGNYTGTKEVSFNVYYPAPTELSRTNVTATTATVTWKDGIATKWTVEYSTDKTFESAERIDVNESTATLASLSADQVYYVRVKAVYGTDQKSDWSNVCTVEPSSKLLIGSGNGTSELLPFSNWYYYNLTQQIYTAEELGKKAGAIMSLDFFRTDDKECDNTIEIYLVKTDKTKFDSNKDWISVTEADKVYDGKKLFENNQWTTIELSKPFDYDGVSNLALIVYDKEVRGDSYGSGRSFRVYQGNGYQTLQYQSDSNNPFPSEGNNATLTPSVTGSRLSTKNQLRIRMADKITMNGLGIMSYASDNVLDFSNVGELTAHYASSFAAMGNNAGVLTMTQVETTPAGEGLMLKGTANETFYVPALFNLTPEALTDNSLKGLTKITEVETTEGDKTNFILSQQKGVIAWYPLAAKYALKAHSAYLQLLTNDVFTGDGTRAISMEFEDGVTTGFIQIATDDVEDGDWYGIDGIKFNQKPTQRGVYINNGRKVIVK